MSLAVWLYVHRPLKPNLAAGVTIAIDTCYEVWDSGIISVPWDFNIHELRPQLIKLLKAGGTPSSASPHATKPKLAVSNMSSKLPVGCVSSTHQRRSGHAHHTVVQKFRDCTGTLQNQVWRMTAGSATQCRLAESSHRLAVCSVTVQSSVMQACSYRKHFFDSRHTRSHRTQCSFRPVPQSFQVSAFL